MKKILSLLLAVACCFALLTACGNNNASNEPSSNESASNNEEVSTDGIDETLDYTALAGTTIKVAASPTPHAEILAIAKDILAKKDSTLDIIEFTDYVQPIMVTESGEVDANYFQHQPYLDDFNAENGTHLVSVATIHYEPFGMYAGKTASIDELADGATIAVPNDGTNEGRALQLLAQEGLITLADDAGLTATVLDIVDNPKNLDIKELEAAQVPRALDSVDMAIINGNYAIDAGLKVSDAVAVEAADSLAADTYGNVICVKEGNEDSDAIKALVAALESEAVREFITSTYDGAVVPKI